MEIILKSGWLIILTLRLCMEEVTLNSMKFIKILLSLLRPITLESTMTITSFSSKAPIQTE